ncbi:MAG: hypothetical protein ABSE06_12475 [Anaerolineaceae bacterium]
MYKSNLFMNYDANFTDGTDPEKMDAVYQDEDGKRSRVRVPNMIVLSLSKPSITADGIDFATLNISTSKSTVTVVLKQGRNTTQVDVPITAGAGSVDITSNFAGSIQIDCIDLCETIYLEAK